MVAYVASSRQSGEILLGLRLTDRLRKVCPHMALARLLGFVRGQMLQSLVFLSCAVLLVLTSKALVVGRRDELIGE